MLLDGAPKQRTPAHSVRQPLKASTAGFRVFILDKEIKYLTYQPHAVYGPIGLKMKNIFLLVPASYVNYKSALVRAHCRMSYGVLVTQQGVGTAQSGRVEFRV